MSKLHDEKNNSNNQLFSINFFCLYLHPFEGEKVGLSWNHLQMIYPSHALLQEVWKVQTGEEKVFGLDILLHNAQVTDRSGMLTQVFEGMDQEEQI